VRGLKLSERILRVIERNYREARDFLKENAKKSLFGNVPIKNLMPFARGVLIPNFQEPKRVFSATFQPKLVRFFSKGSDLDVFVPEGGAVNLGMA
jgi:hypothetical protein